MSCNLLKIQEKLVLWHLQEDLKIEESLNKSQYGFKKGSSTEAAVLNLVNKIQEAMKNDEHALGIFLDIQGAFDNLPHFAIRKALNKTAARGMIGEWIMHMVMNRKINLRTAGKTITRNIPKGCPQGGVLSPFLWNLVLDSLLKKCHKDDNVQAFADDVSLLSIGKIKYGVINKAKNTMKMIMDWCKENGLEISALKTKLIYWSKSKAKDHPTSIIVDGTEFKLSTSVKYLGVIIDNKLNWNEHINEIVMKSKKTYFAVKKQS